MNFVTSWLAGVPEAATPYALAAFGLIIAERSGVLNLTAEGLMLIGAMSGIGACLTFDGYPEAAMLAAMLAAAVTSLLFALLVVVLRINQVIAGLAVVFFCQGLTSFLGSLLGWQNQPVTGLGAWPIPFLHDIPMIGRVLFTQNIVVYLTPLICLGVQMALDRTMIGLKVRAVGENPDAADAAGVSVLLVRTGAIVTGAALVGLAGALLSVGGVKIWFPALAGGRGWIAVALVIFARWQPWRALGGAMLFGSIEALIPHIAAAGIQAPQYLMLMAPYVATLAVMVWSGIGTRLWSDEPAALGQPYFREERR